MPRQASAAMIAMIIRATSTSTSVKPRARFIRRRTARGRMVERVRMPWPASSDTWASTRRKFGLGVGRTTILPESERFKLFAAEIAVTHTWKRPVELERGELVVGAPLRQRHVLQALGVGGQRSGGL